MRKAFLIFVTLLIVPSLYMACDRDEPVVPKEYTLYPHPDMAQITGTAYYCTTNTQFVNAIDNATIDDWIYLTNDTTIFTYTVTVWPAYAACKAIPCNISGVSNGVPATVRLYNNHYMVEHDIGWVLYDNAYDIKFTKPVYIFYNSDPHFIRCGGTDGTLSLYLYSSGAVHAWVVNAISPLHTNMANFGHDDTVRVWGSYFANANDPCDFSVSYQGNEAVGDHDYLDVHDWYYNTGDCYPYCPHYSNDAITDDPESAGSCWLSVCEEPTSQTLYVRFTWPYEQFYWGGNDDLMEFTLEYGPTTSYGSTGTLICGNETEDLLYGQLDVTGYSQGDWIHYKMTGAMCDRSWTTGDLSFKIPKGPYTCMEPTWLDCEN